MKGGNKMTANVKKYQVEISQIWSETINVSAKNITEAKQKAWEKWKAKKVNYRLSVDWEEEPK